MNRGQLLKDLESAFVAEEARLKTEAEALGAMHGSVMPRTYVGSTYGAGQFGGQRVPRILVMSINQSRQGQCGLKDDRVRNSMGVILLDERGRFRPDGFGPRALAANLSRWILMQCGVSKDAIAPQEVHDLIAYDNFVKWPFNVDSSKPPEKAWAVFYGTNKAVIEILKPDIILSLGHPMYDHLSDALKEQGDWATGYGWEGGTRGWAGTLRPTPWGACQLGRCYHYSNPIWPNKAWKELRENGTVPGNIQGLTDGKSSRQLLQVMEEMGKDGQPGNTQYPWWGEDAYQGKAFTSYNPYQKYVAWKVCQAMTSRWKQGAS